MSWLVVLRPARPEMPFEPTEEESRVVGEHIGYLQTLRDEGKLVLAGPSQVAPGETIGTMRAFFDVTLALEQGRVGTHNYPRASSK